MRQTSLPAGMPRGLGSQLQQGGQESGLIWRREIVPAFDWRRAEEAKPSSAAGRALADNGFASSALRNDQNSSKFEIMIEYRAKFTVIGFLMIKKYASTRHSNTEG